MKEYLHHYTSIESLEAILYNRTIRFTTLSNADDLDEGNSSDLANIGRFVFTSCWTEAEEKYTMWDSRYGDYMKGIRISLPKFPFVKYQIYESSIKNGGESITEGNVFESFIPDVFRDPSRFLINHFNESNFLLPIEYTDDLSLLYPSVYNIQEEINETAGRKIKTTNYNINIGAIGRYKAMAWEDQREVRYRFHVSPFTFLEMKEATTPEAVFQLQKRYTDIETNLPFSFVDLSIDDAVLSDMIVMTGPQMSNNDYIRTIQLVSRFNPLAQVVKSKIRVRTTP